MIKVDINEIEIIVTKAAINQIKLIISNDFTLKNQVFRLKVDGKGCGGFDYALGFSTPEPDDLVYKIDSELSIHIDPFTAYYSKQGTIDFIQDFENNLEGFHFNNENEKKYKGKFFKNEELVPEI